VGEIDAAYDADELVMVEANIDDMNPEIVPYVVEKLMGAGAVDAYVVPLIMKKGRPGILIAAMVDTVKRDEVLRVMFSETSTIGVRMYPVYRRKLPRERREVSTSLGAVFMKVIVRDGRERLVPEHEECRRIAREKGIPLIEVYRTLEREFFAVGKGR
jgi:hypothetical protein